MNLSQLSPPVGALKKRKRVGRGEGSGLGKTSGRGHKGQKARSGGGVRPGFEGGQMPLQRRLPKRGFNNIFKKKYALVNLSDLESFPANSEIDSSHLEKAGLIRSNSLPVKLLGQGEVKVALKIKCQAASRSAIEKIEAKGGSVSILTL
ncbi:MAG: 50S ribosomal protein L15 [Deltaproteobacteria bacterium]|jgi:large subunit ribosomal protein L15|nr:50S ribosomal protein L15 [Deltaproteobacteria bacterium]